jgi:hypothetical protein
MAWCAKRFGDGPYKPEKHRAVSSQHFLYERFNMSKADIVFKKMQTLLETLDDPMDQMKKAGRLAAECIGGFATSKQHAHNLADVFDTSLRMTIEIMSLTDPYTDDLSAATDENVSED